VRPRLPTRRASLVLASSLLIAAGVQAPPPQLPDTLPSDPQVKDGVFAVLLGLVETDSYGSLTSEHLGRDMVRRGVTSRLPYRKLRSLTRSSDEAQGTARVEVVFAGPLRMPIPYTILGYHPGSLKADETCVFREWRFGMVEVPVAAGSLAIQDVYAFTFQAGSIRIDFDAWLDWLMGSALDDTQVSGIALYRLRGRWIGLALGLNDKREPRSGSFDFQQDKVLIPPPEETRAVARHLRARMQALPR
jgi:hypothetical protein